MFKQYIMGGVCALMLSVSAVAASPVVAKSSAAVPSLVGTWQSIDAKNGALHGKIVLNADATASMKPEAGTKDVMTPLMTGTWTVKAKSLILTMPPYGTSTMKYELVNAKRLRLTYDNNNTQTFERK